jgi:nitrogen fixation protein NifX
MGSSVKVAFATSDMKRVDQHFGSADSFAIYAMDPEQASLREAVKLGRSATDGNEDKLATKIQIVDGCVAVYCQAIGASAIKQLRVKGIQAVKVTPGFPIKDLVLDLQAELRAGPRAWLARAMEQQRPWDARRCDEMELEGWVE